MKKIIVYLFMITASFSLNGCYDLDTYPGDSLGEALFWKTEDHVKQALMGVYQHMRNNDAYGRQFMCDLLGDVAYGYSLYHTFQLGTHTDRTENIANRWQAIYEGVQRANGFIGQVSTLDFLSDEARAEYVAEAKFLRALYYFTLLDLFGGV
ncbi:MAG: RagB/SusD family nutrient uptake outer membrane protein, partial [Tannerella sp.]|nr:RagB/SusD family nutrient uptake outer membrane protein [Tannerella sp.]